MPPPPELQSTHSQQGSLSSSLLSGPPELESHSNISGNQTQESCPSLNKLLLLASEDAAIDEPQTYKEAVTGPNRLSWKEAIDCEMSAHENNRTWDVVKRPNSGTTLTAKWIFKIKRSPDGKPKRFKARLVARGYKQQAGVDYSETFAPVAKMDSIRTLLAIAAAKGLCIEQFDVSTAFLNGDITDKIYIEPPEGINIAKDECLKLKEALYGLKQAPRVWNSKFDQVAKKLQFKPLSTDPCVYISDGCDLFLGIYVDDGLVIGPSSEKCIQVIEALNQVFAVKRLENQTFLGIEIINTSDGLFLSQRRYILDILARFNMADSKPRSAPMHDIRALFEKGVGRGQVVPRPGAPCLAADATPAHGSPRVRNTSPVRKTPMRRARAAAGAREGELRRRWLLAPFGGWTSGSGCPTADLLGNRQRVSKSTTTRSPQEPRAGYEAGSKAGLARSISIPNSSTLSILSRRYLTRQKRRKN